jgi:hypothetical protein
LDCVLPGVHRHEESERLGWAIPDSYKDVDARSRQFPRPSINCPGGPECPTDAASSITCQPLFWGSGVKTASFTEPPSCYSSSRPTPRPERGHRCCRRLLSILERLFFQHCDEGLAGQIPKNGAHLPSCTANKLTHFVTGCKQPI